MAPIVALHNTPLICFDKVVTVHVKVIVSAVTKIINDRVVFSSLLSIIPTL